MIPVCCTPYIISGVTAWVEVYGHTQPRLMSRARLELSCSREVVVSSCIKYEGYRGKQLLLNNLLIY